MPVLEKKKLEKIVVDGIVKEFGPDAFGDPDDVNPSEFKTSMFFDSFERVKIKSVCSDEKGRPVWVLPMPEDFQMLGQTGDSRCEEEKSKIGGSGAGFGRLLMCCHRRFAKMRLRIFQDALQCGWCSI